MKGRQQRRKFRQSFAADGSGDCKKTLKSKQRQSRCSACSKSGKSGEQSRSSLMAEPYESFKIGMQPRSNVLTGKHDTGKIACVYQMNVPLFIVLMYPCISSVYACCVVNEWPVSVHAWSLGAGWHEPNSWRYNRRQLRRNKWQKSWRGNKKRKRRRARKAAARSPRPRRSPKRRKCSKSAH